MYAKKTHRIQSEEARWRIVCCSPRSVRCSVSVRQESAARPSKYDPGRGASYLCLLFVRLVFPFSLFLCSVSKRGVLSFFVVTRKRPD